MITPPQFTCLDTLPIFACMPPVSIGQFSSIFAQVPEDKSTQGTLLIFSLNYHCMTYMYSLSNKYIYTYCTKLPKAKIGPSQYIIQ